MFDILESIALEQAKTEYGKKTKKAKKKPKKNNLVSSSFIDQKDKNKLGSRVSKDTTASMQVGRSKSISMTGQRSDDLAAIGRVMSKGGGMDFENEEQKESGLAFDSKNSDSSSSMINMDETLLDDEDDFEDAEEGIVTSLSHDK